VLIQGTRQLLKHPSKNQSCKASQRLVDVALNCSRFALKRMSLAEILEELPKLTEEERDELRSRLDEYDPGFLSILQERVRGIESGERETIPADQVIAEGRRLAQELAQQWAPNSTKKPGKNTSTQSGFTAKPRNVFLTRWQLASKKCRNRQLGFEQTAPDIRTCRVEKFPYQLLFALKEDWVYIIAVKHVKHRAPEHILVYDLTGIETRRRLG
jgi:hypothetical protein